MPSSASMYHTDPNEVAGAADTKESVLLTSGENEHREALFQLASHIAERYGLSMLSRWTQQLQDKIRRSEFSSAHDPTYNVLECCSACRDKSTSSKPAPLRTSAAARVSAMRSSQKNNSRASTSPSRARSPISKSASRNASPSNPTVSALPMEGMPAAWWTLWNARLSAAHRVLSSLNIHLRIRNECLVNLCASLEEGLENLSHCALSHNSTIVKQLRLVLPLITFQLSAKEPPITRHAVTIINMLCGVLGPIMENMVADTVPKLLVASSSHKLIVLHEDLLGAVQELARNTRPAVRMLPWLVHHAMNAKGTGDSELCRKSRFGAATLALRILEDVVELSPAVVKVRYSIDDALSPLEYYIPFGKNAADVGNGALRTLRRLIAAKHQCIPSSITFVSREGEDLEVGAVPLETSVQRGAERSANCSWEAHPLVAINDTLGAAHNKVDDRDSADPAQASKPTASAQAVLERTAVIECDQQQLKSVDANGSSETKSVFNQQWAASTSKLLWQAVMGLLTQDGASDSVIQPHLAFVTMYILFPDQAIELLNTTFSSVARRNVLVRLGLVRKDEAAPPFEGPKTLYSVALQASFADGGREHPAATIDVCQLLEEDMSENAEGTRVPEARGLGPRWSGGVLSSPTRHTVLVARRSRRPNATSSATTYMVLPANTASGLGLPARSDVSPRASSRYARTTVEGVHRAAQASRQPSQNDRAPSAAATSIIRPSVSPKRPQNEGGTEGAPAATAPLPQTRKTHQVTWTRFEL